MKKNILLLASLVAGLSVAACDRNDSTTPFGRTTADERARAAETGSPKYPSSSAPSSSAPSSSAPSSSVPASSAPASAYPATTDPVTGIPSSDMPPRAMPTKSDDTRKDQIDATVEQTKVQRDKVLDDVYSQYVVATGEKKDKDVPMAFKSHCDSAGKGDKVMGADQTKAFFAQSDVQQKCAEYVRLGKDADMTKKQK